ncbi:MAG: hypothetical protein QNJ37_18005 [Crocosphaera sp.]|nr:hypothetical protein [Crocosphaera sp.]
MSKPDPKGKLEKAISTTTKLLKGVGETLSLLINKGKEIGEASKPVQAAVVGAGAGVLLCTATVEEPSALQTGAAAAIGGGTLGYIAKSLEDRQKQKAYQILQQSNYKKMRMLGRSPELDSVLIPNLKENLKTESMYFKETLTKDPLELEAWLDDSSSNSPEQPHIEGQSQELTALPQAPKESVLPILWGQTSKPQDNLFIENSTNASQMEAFSDNLSFDYQQLRTKEEEDYETTTESAEEENNTTDTQ